MSNVQIYTLILHKPQDLHHIQKHNLEERLVARAPTLIRSAVDCEWYLALVLP